MGTEDFLAGVVAKADALDAAVTEYAPLFALLPDALRVPLEEGRSAFRQLLDFVHRQRTASGVAEADAKIDAEERAKVGG